MRKFYFLVLVWLSFSLLISSTPTAAQQPEKTQYFPDTGHWVRGDFLEKWRSASNPVLIYGWPITETFISGGIEVQYFQRARLEYYPSNPPGRRVVIANLGPELLEAATVTPLNVSPLPANHPACLTFSENKHQVCYAFKDFYQENGGLDQFGHPISDLVKVNSWLVQYFERARLEWHPELPSGKRVTLTQIGQMYFDIKEDRTRLMPVLDNTVGTDIKSLRVSIFPVHATMEPSGEQSLYIIVQDQQLRPIPDARVNVVVTLPSGGQVPTVIQTNKNGVAVATFSQSEEPQGLAQIQVQVYYINLKQDGRGSYRVW
jgi:hypothetical protein